ncbi:MAG: hypothetical protein ACKOEM_00955 [Planctomycetia bacterium]
MKIELERRSPSLSRRAVERRVAHRLIPQSLILRKCSPRSRWHSSLGDYYLTRVADRFVMATHQDLEELARELDAIREDESIIGEEAAPAA